MLAAEKAKAEASQKTASHKSVSNLPPPEGIDVEFDEVSNPHQGTVVGPEGGTLISSRFGIRIIIPPNSVQSPVKIECRLLEKKGNSGRTIQPNLKDAEALANRVLEISPAGTYFSKPVSIEIPYYIAIEGYSREICVMSSERGDGWSDCKSCRVLPIDENSDDDEYYVAISTQSLPSYFAVISRICREDADISNDGGAIFSSFVPFVRVDVPPGCFHKESDSYIQVLPVYPDDLSVTSVSGATPVVTLEPRIRLKQAVTITLPDLVLHPKADPNSPIRLLRSITPYDKQPQWEDITDSTEIIDEGNGILSFSTNQFARYWIIQVRQALTAKDKGSTLYRKITAVPYLANVAIFANSYQPGEASMRIACMTNDGLYDSLDFHEGMVQIASKENVPIIDGSRVSIQCSGNLLPIKAKSASWQMDFKPYRENVLDGSVRVTTPSDPPKGLMSFVRDAKVDGRTVSQMLCTLGVVLPQGEGPEGNVTISHEYRVFAETMDVAIKEITEHGIGNSESNDDQSNIASVAAVIGNDWPQLARELQLKESDIKAIDAECSPNSTAAAQNILHTWAVRSGRDATGVKLESALVGIGREDVIEHFESEVASGVTYEKTQLPGGQIVIKKKISRRLPLEEIEKLKRSKDTVVTAEGHIVQTKQTVITGSSSDRDQMLAKLRQQMDLDEQELRNSAAGEILSEEIEFQHEDVDIDLVDEIRTDVERRKYDGYARQQSAKSGYGGN
ncbi:uncharacterized protein TRIADDRAFT_24276 [Trichoplax adhaerens]|uniref:Death domain-containing protein n=1 Tax=Trichoplax adhaerens TaxID=10228 RepID=B3RVS2_TRIAD|nr:hypothetical protein TRIADDRAFT_24276 [Trichoplax adhaerens]EDV26047.1 hypothetical protein TRIADDRAFT_24276 [Trichoplax adhaerens]|eukprot:XP_002112080.1 hypothetical protein TRIADDRAFT_24276 [Trichoplax adhaerens]